MAAIDYSTTGIVTSPVSVKGVADLISAGTYDVGSICTSANINKWSIYKPYRLSGVGLLTLAQIKNIHCGLTEVFMPTLCTYLGSTHPTPSSDYVPSDEAKEWEYSAYKPTGGSASPYRICDFVSKKYVEEKATDDYAGYNHKALPSDNGWNDMIMTKTTLTELIDAKVSISGDSYSFVVSAVSSSGAGNFGHVYSNFNIRFGVSTYLGGLNSNAMPFNYIAGSIGSDIWRMGLAVKVTGPGGTPQYHLFISKSPLDTDDASVSAMCPDFVTNTYALVLMQSVLDSVTSYELIPVLCKNVGIVTDLTLNGYSGLVCPYLDSTSKIYCMPSGTVSINMKISDNGSGVSKDDFEACVVASGQYAHIGSTYIPINNLYIRYKGTSTLTQDVQVTYSIVYTMYDSDKEYTISGTHVFVKGSTSGTLSNYKMAGIGLGVKSYNIEL